MESQHHIIRALQHTYTQARKIPRRTHGRVRCTEDNITDNMDTSLSHKVIGQDRMDDRQFDPALQLHIDHILIDRRQHSSVVDIHFFKGPDCDTDHYMVVANLGRDWQ
jgi:hypothetical protein